MRAKLNKPDADGMCSGARPDMLRLISGTKNTATAAPWMIVGTRSVKTSACVLNHERISRTTAKMTNDAVAKTRGSTRFMYLPTTGMSRIASTPTGARIMPAHVAV